MFKHVNWRYVGLLVLLFCSGCALFASLDLDQQFGQSQVEQREQAIETLGDPFVPALVYQDAIEPIINSRCVVCHACYDAPCQLKLTSPEGIERGGNKTKVYNGTRLVADTPNRLFIDAFGTQQWRERGFFPVLNEREQTSEANTQASVLARMLLLKQQYPLPEQKLLDNHFDFSLDRQQQCPTVEEMQHYEQSQPLAGMPYGLPGLSPSEHSAMLAWLKSGAYLPPPESLPVSELAQVNKWEQFLNEDSLKRQLSARYIYEHLFASHLYFADTAEADKQPQFYNLIRSRTPPGQALDVIATRRPFDDPKAERVYYRFQPVTATIVDKTHMPYALDTALWEKWQSWFVQAQFSPTQLPGYAPDIAANPLTAFAELPPGSRYRFMLERAENTIMGFIKGPVCRGQVALNVINDRFWVYFVRPELAEDPDIAHFYRSQRQNLTMPAEQESTALAVTWLKYAAHQGDYMRARSQFMNDNFANGEHLTLDGIWDGDGENSNASLTVFRHFDNATVVKGLVGEPPKTAWIIDYALFERIHYLLVAGFDVYGNYGHQLLTRLYMDFLRMEGESNFLALLPPETRHQEFESWYQHAGPQLTQFIGGDINPFTQPTGIEYHSDTPKQELYQMLATRLASVQPNAYSLDDSELGANSIALLKELNHIRGLRAALLPELTMIMVEPADGGKAEIFTLVRNSAHYNISSLFDEEANRQPSEDDVTLVHGLLGSYPGAFWYIKEQDLAAVVARAQEMQTETDYEKLLDRIAVRRTDPNFWAFSDRLNQAYQQHDPVASGWLDYNRLQNR